MQIIPLKCVFQASTSKQMRTALVWVITQRVLVFSYRRFGTTYQSHFQGSGSFLIPEDGTDRLLGLFKLNTKITETKEFYLPDKGGKV